MGDTRVLAREQQAKVLALFRGGPLQRAVHDVCGGGGPGRAELLPRHLL